MDKVKRYFSLFLIIFIFINVFSNIPFTKADSAIDRATIVYELKNSTKAIKVGDTFKVDIYITSNNNEVPINYASIITEFNGQIASFVKTDNTNTSFPTVFTNKAVNNIITYKAGKPKGWYGTKGLLVTLTFKALKIGTFNLNSNIKSLIFTNDTVDILFGKASHYQFSIGGIPTPNFSYSVNKITLVIGSTTMNVDGKTVNIDTSPVIKDSRTLLPVRAIAESTNSVVSWDSKTKTVLIREQNDSTISLTIGRPNAILNNFAERQIDPDNIKVVPLIINSRTMLPLRFVGESMGFDIEWIPETKTIILIK